MFRDILVPLDSSRFAEAALPMAVQLARRANAHLHLVLAHQPVAALVGMGDLGPPPASLDPERRVREASYLAGTAERASRFGEELVEFHEVEGPAGPALCEEATRLDADLVIMASHGRGALGRFWLGSVADYVMRHLSIPVLLLHPERDPKPGAARELRGILVALDFSKNAEAILGSVIQLAQLTQAHVTLLHVLKPIYEVGPGTLPYPVIADQASLDTSRAEAQRRLDAVADRLRERGVSVSSRVSMSLTPASGVLEALEQSRIDLLAMTTRGAGGARRLLLGSVADKVVRAAAKPVLVLRPPPEL